MQVIKYMLFLSFLLVGFAACVSTQPTPSYGPMVGMPAEPGKCYAKSVFPDPIPGAEYREGLGYLAWAEVVCEGDINSKLVRKLKQALHQAGDLSAEQVSSGDPDEVFHDALMKYQKRERLPRGGFNKQTLTHLGVKW